MPGRGSFTLPTTGTRSDPGAVGLHRALFGSSGRHVGMELNAERERSRELAAEVPRAEREIQLEPRDEPNDRQTT